MPHFSSLHRSSLHRAAAVTGVLFTLPLFAGAGCGSSSAPGGTSSAQTSDDGGACAASDCAGLAATAEAKVCPDGTGLGRSVCTRESNSQCAWDFPACPTADAGAFDAALTGDAGGACSSDADCPSGTECGFLLADACTAVGTCVAAAGVRCEAYSVGCGCDGSAVNVACTGLPDGYEHAPVRHAGACTDGG